MKFLALSILLLSSSSFAAGICSSAKVDHAGHFQMACELTSDSSSYTFILDNYRSTFLTDGRSNASSQNIVYFDGVIFGISGGSQVFARAYPATSGNTLNAQKFCADGDFNAYIALDYDSQFPIMQKSDSGLFTKKHMTVWDINGEQVDLKCREI